MARPRKEGLDYFPLDIYFDEKVKALESLHKNDGLVWIIKFWQNAYASNTGFVNLKGVFGVIQAENCRITPGKQAEIISNCLEIGLITRIRDDIFTSNGIQKRLNMVITDRESERKRKLVGSFPTENKPLTGESKVKESKVYSTAKQPSSQFDFESVWALYPKRLGKKEALRHFNASVKTDQDFKDIHTALERFMQSEVAKRELKFVPYGSTWFNNWRDYLEVQADPQEEIMEGYR